MKTVKPFKKPLAFFLFVCLVFSIPLAWAVMPPEYYARSANKSVIKAIALVEKVEVVERTKQANRKKVLFRREYGVTAETPPTFTAYCSSVDHFWQGKMVGGDIYYYPQKGERVFVTVSTDGGYITSYTQMTPELEQTIRKKPEKLIYRFGTASFE